MPLVNILYSQIKARYLAWKFFLLTKVLLAFYFSYYLSKITYKLKKILFILKVHCGNGEWVTLESYDFACNQGSPSKFVRAMAVTIIGITMLKERSVSGHGCHRTKTAPKPKIPDSKMGAIRGNWNIWLKLLT